MTRLASALAAVRRVLHAIIGAPDYERYVAHVRECHPGSTPMTRAAFEQSRMEDKYSRPGNRCC